MAICYLSPSEAGVPFLWGLRAGGITCWPIPGKGQSLEVPSVPKQMTWEDGEGKGGVPGRHCLSGGGRQSAVPEELA